MKTTFNPQIEVFDPFKAPFSESTPIALDLRDMDACSACTACTACK